MTKPLTLLLYERILPGGQLVNRLQDLGHRVQTLTDAAQLLPQAEREKPMLVIADLEPNPAPACAAITALRANETTHHIPVIAIAAPANLAAHESARAAGATLVVHDSTILQHLTQFLDQALHID